MEMRRGGEKNRASSRQTPVAPPPPKALKGLDTSFEDLYILIETDELQYLLEVGTRLSLADTCETSILL